MQLQLRLLVIATFCSSLLGCAQPSKELIPKQYIAYKTAKNIVIDGDESDASWDKAQWSDAFIDIEGVNKPKYNTKVKILWDDTYFYILAKLEEPHVWATLKQRDTIIFYNNDFEVFIDPDGDTFNYYELEINALNTAWDLFINKPYREEGNVVLNDWTLTGLKSAVKVNGTINNPNDIDKGWVLEMAIPWAAYKTSYFHDNVPRDRFWRVDFSRVNWQHTITDGRYARKKDANGKFLPEYNWVWSPMGVINMHEPEKWGYVYFSSKEVGAKDSFDIPQDDKVKWELYSLYRRQKAYFKTHESWATSIDSISKEPISVDGNLLKPSLENHKTGYTISVKSPFSNKTLIIKEDGTIISK
ncbi:carbohydrate-binding family 9-like protein [Confluentibacter sediminis]|uniref:carbohydrate-binding family 9-like protein n=1 Tax=Confluentibacter sediminis TaxID=2219045 RepID=UPI000DADE116|nr:carbohydrate-binding family 9-like protein [Confluentibacter sediminis]